ncbi:MAG: hypothetical protein MZV65_32240 [Chromatiales bacterium]|nr:hypothetical protein [Chromatiales bacterium]
MLRGQVMRVVPRENEADQRDLDRRPRPLQLRRPVRRRPLGASRMVREGGVARSRLGGRARGRRDRACKDVIAQHGAELGGPWSSPTATRRGAVSRCSSCARGLGVDNVDHRLRQAGFPRPGHGAGCFLGWGSRRRLEQVSARCCSSAPTCARRQPLIAHRIRKAALRGRQVVFINPQLIEFRFPVAAKRSPAPATAWRQHLAGVASAVADADRPTPGEPARAAAARSRAEPSGHGSAASGASDLRLILLGALAERHAGVREIRALAQRWPRRRVRGWATCPKARTPSARALAGAMPHRGAGRRAMARPGLAALEMLQARLRGYLLSGRRAELDCWRSAAAPRRRMQGAECVRGPHAVRERRAAEPTPT